MNGSASAPSSATMKATLCAMRPLMKCTSRDRRSSFATMTVHLSRRASARNVLLVCGKVNLGAHIRTDVADVRDGDLRLDGQRILVQHDVENLLAKHSKLYRPDAG